jgi:UDP-N-acetylmuramoylalanine--D-glutamate ligase
MAVPERVEALRGSRIALLGLGVENRALARFLGACGLRFSACDAAEPGDWGTLRREWGNAVEEWHLGAGYLDLVDRFDLAFRTPGISPLRPELQRARERGVRISSQTRLFTQLSPAPILGVTGTKGKGTTVSLIAEILRDGPFRKVHVGGNIGTPPIGFLDALGAADLVVLELSSFQLIDWERSPHVALVLGVVPDHLDYHASIEEYVEAKRNICRFQESGDLLIFDRDCPTASGFASGSRARRSAFSALAEVDSGTWAAADRLWIRRSGRSAEEICPLADIPLRGRHNWRNAAAAAAAAAAVGAAVAQIAAGLRRGRGLEHRLEQIGSWEGVTYYDDSLATTPAAAQAAILAFDEPLVLIAGGSSKGADFSALGELIARRDVRAVVLLGREASRIEAAIRRAGGFAGEIVTGCTSMRTAVAAARARARPGDVVLLSPACASFDMFASYKDRGKQFRRAASPTSRRASGRLQDEG